jgi:hypothetical protein
MQLDTTRLPELWVRLVAGWGGQSTIRVERPLAAAGRLMVPLPGRRSIYQIMAAISVPATSEQQLKVLIEPLAKLRRENAGLSFGNATGE